MNRYLANSNLKTEQKQQVADAFSKFAEAMATGSEDYFMQKTAADSWMDILGDSESLELIKETEDEMAGNIQALIDLLSESVLEMDLSFITGKGIVSGNIELIGQFLQIILELIMHMANEEEDSPE